MADKPETLEETQARLARVQQAAAQPGASAEVPGAPAPVASGTPYGPPPTTRPDPYRDSAPQHTGVADPYGGAAPVHPPAPIGPPKSRAAGLIVGVGVAVFLLIGGIVAYGAFSYRDPADPFAGPDDPLAEPEYSEEWQRFPGISYLHPDEVLAQPSYEEVVASAETMTSEFRDTLTAEFGLVWSEQYEPNTFVASNGYGGDSMLHYYTSGYWQGQVQLDDPGARQRVYDLFLELIANNGGNQALLRNELYADDSELSKTDFGATDLEDQALWSFHSSFPSLALGHVSVDLIDRTIPVDATFDGDWLFTYDESADTFYVVVVATVGPLLKEGDREAFEEALEPYNGDYEP